MRFRILCALVGALLVATMSGCGGGGAKGKNRDLDRPAATNK